MWQKAEEYAPKQVCQHTSEKVIVTGKISRVLYVNFECLFWPIKYMHSKPRFWVHFGHCFASSMPFLRILFGKKQRNMFSTWLPALAKRCTNRCQRQRKQSFLFEFSIRTIYTMITNHTHACTTLPLGNQNPKKQVLSHQFLQVQRSANHKYVI